GALKEKIKTCKQQTNSSSESSSTNQAIMENPHEEALSPVLPSEENPVVISRKESKEAKTAERIAKRAEKMAAKKEKKCKREKKDKKAVISTEAITDSVVHQEEPIKADEALTPAEDPSPKIVADKKELVKIRREMRQAMREARRAIKAEKTT